jgi:hypothetical protein
MEYLFLTLGAICKAFADRCLWGSGNDSINLWYENFPLYKKWCETEARILWIPLDFWHTADLWRIIFTILGGMFMEKTFESFAIGLTLFLSVFTIFFHVLLWSDFYSGIKDFMKKYL